MTDFAKEARELAPEIAILVVSLVRNGHSGKCSPEVAAALTPVFARMHAEGRSEGVAEGMAKAAEIAETCAPMLEVGPSPLIDQTMRIKAAILKAREAILAAAPPKKS